MSEKAHGDVSVMCLMTFVASSMLTVVLGVLVAEKFANIQKQIDEMKATSKGD